MHLGREDELRQTNKKSSRRVKYPIHSSNPERVKTELQAEIVDDLVADDEGNIEWDDVVKQCVKTIKRTAKRLKQRRYWRAKARKKRERASIATRRGLIEASEDDAKVSSVLNAGHALQRSNGSVRRRFRRVSVWERDQTVSRILPTPGTVFAPESSIADKFAQEWNDIQGRSHRTVPLHDLTCRLDEFAIVPTERRVTDEHNAALTAAMDVYEVVESIRALNREKAAGPDGLNNDFYIDMEDVMAPILTRVGNAILNGERPPQTFLEGLIIPLRKKGDSTSAMDYRPITLLQTSYKIVAKVLATRLQGFLGRLIGDSQQGFVHGRNMNKTVTMMLAHLKNAVAEPAVGLEDSAGVLLLDFKKA
ncbi:Reverse transcriptase precursor [Phytophthora megakarya]|uniref:Reverse transcriptase n=1 Tax=Phytophthora megakarya TaxID=4795 RepID=A0A225W3Q2_9STRA|nr:Reverse transcriptase precursor [Phytophthora megakarya]